MSDVRVYRWISTLSKGPGFLVLFALGWALEWIDERYWSVLLSHLEADDSTTEVS